MGVYHPPEFLKMGVTDSCNLLSLLEPRVEDKKRKIEEDDDNKLSNPNRRNKLARILESEDDDTTGNNESAANDNNVSDDDFQGFEEQHEPKKVQKKITDDVKVMKTDTVHSGGKFSSFLFT